MMSVSLTQEMTEKVAKVMRENNIPPRIIKTEKEAKELTAADPFGKTWKVGDEYYHATKHGADFAI